jgi:hypothetical protein
MRLIPLTLIALALVPAAARAADVYPIHLQRNFHVGDIYELHYSCEIQTDTTLSGDVHTPGPKPFHFKAELLARIQAVDIQTDPARQQFILTVKHLRNTAGRDTMPPGTVMDVIETADSCEFTPHGRFFVPDNAKPYLLQFFGRLGHTPVDADLAIGTPTPQAVGGCWKIHSGPTADLFSLQGLRLLPTSLAGTDTLTAIEAASPSPLLHLDSTITGTDFTVDRLPKGALMESSHVTIHCSKILPEDSAQLPREFTTTTDATAHLTTITDRVQGDFHDHSVYTCQATPVTLGSATLVATVPSSTHP